MNRRLGTQLRRLSVLAVAATISLAGVLNPAQAGATAARRTYAFHATYSGTIALRAGSPLAQRHATGTATLLGASTLALADQNTHLPPRDSRTQCVAGEGDGTLTAPSGDSLAVLFVFSGNLFGPTVGSCPLPVGVGSGYYLIFGGTGKFAGASGSGTFHERQPDLVRPGRAVPITDTFTGTVTLQR